MSLYLGSFVLCCLNISRCKSQCLEYPHVEAEQDEGRKDADGVDERHQDQENEEATFRWRHLADQKFAH